MRQIYLLSILLLSGIAQAADNKMLLFKDDKSFVVVENYNNESCPEVTFKRVPNYMVDKSIREVSGEKLAQAVARGSVYVQLQRTNDGGYAVHALPKGPGGGPWGAGIGYMVGAFIGNAVVLGSSYAVLYGSKKIVGKFAGPDAEDRFYQAMEHRMIPHAERVAERASHWTGAVGAGIGGAIIPG